jgi:hypothetical protein
MNQETIQLTSQGLVEKFWDGVQLARQRRVRWPLDLIVESLNKIDINNDSKMIIRPQFIPSELQVI